MNEEWKPISWAQRYEVSSLGAVRSLEGLDAAGRPRKGKRLVPFRNGKKGYMAVDIQGRRVKVHRLVCEAFHGAAPAGKPQVNHLDGNRAHNASHNLEWCDQSHNALHSYEALGRVSSGGHAGKTGALHHCSKAVVARHTVSGEVRIFGSTHEAARAIGLSSGSVPRCCNGIQAHSKGWTFRYSGASA